MGYYRSPSRSRSHSRHRQYNDHYRDDYARDQHRGAHRNDTTRRDAQARDSPRHDGRYRESSRHGARRRDSPPRDARRRDTSRYGARHRDSPLHDEWDDEWHDSDGSATMPIEELRAKVEAMEAEVRRRQKARKAKLSQPVKDPVPAPVNNSGSSGINRQGGVKPVPTVVPKPGTDSDMSATSAGAFQSNRAGSTLEPGHTNQHSRLPAPESAATKKIKAGNQFLEQLRVVWSMGHQPRPEGAFAPKIKECFDKIHTVDSEQLQDARLLPFRYGSMIGYDFNLCRYFFGSTKACPYGRDCKCQHRPLSDEQMEHIRTSPKKGQATPLAFLRTAYENWSSPQPPEVSWHVREKLSDHDWIATDATLVAGNLARQSLTASFGGSPLAASNDGARTSGRC